MGSNVTPDFPSQPVSLMGSIRAGKPVVMTDIATEQQIKDKETFIELAVVGADTRAFNMQQWVSSGQFYVTKKHHDHVEYFHNTLDKAVTDIVERWYSDEKASFPTRMPLRDNEDKILRWIDGPGRAVVPPYKGRQGNWRPDYLLEKVVLPDGTVTENPRICEINARFPWNGFVFTAHMAAVVEKLGVAKAGLRTSMSPGMDELFGLFDMTKPLHIVNEKFDMRDPSWFADLYCKKTGQPVRVIKPSDLRWLPDENSDGAHRVFCPTEDGVGIEKVHQVDFEIEQEEFEAIDFEIICHLAPNCINDLRSVFFINDQRFLGIVYEELEDLVSRGTLNQSEADVLRQGLAPSFLPTSSTWTKVIEESKANPTVKDQWVLKYARSGLSIGHIFGKVTDNAEWLDKLTSAQANNCNPDGDSYVLQRYVEQTEYDAWSHFSNDILRSHYVPSYFASNGKFLGIGGARTANLTVLSMMKGQGFLMCIVADA